MRNLKEEVELLKHTVKSHSSIIQEGNMIKKLINDLKDDSQKIKEENNDLVQKIYMIEKEFQSDNENKSQGDKIESLENNETETNSEYKTDILSVSESSSCKKTRVKCKDKKTIAGKLCDSNVDLIHCDLCNYKCRKETSLQTHINTKHNKQSCNILKDKANKEKSRIILDADKILEEVEELLNM